MSNLIKILGVLFCPAQGINHPLVQCLCAVDTPAL